MPHRTKYHFASAKAAKAPSRYCQGFQSLSTKCKDLPKLLTNWRFSHYAFFADNQGRQAMDLLPTLLAFAAGFLTCLLLVGAAIWWSFSDRRVRETDSMIGNRHEERAA